MQSLYQRFQVSYHYPVHFTRGIFSSDNPLFVNVLQEDGNISVRKILFVIDSGVAGAHPQLVAQIRGFAEKNHTVFQLCGEPMIVAGGEACKNTGEWVEKIEQAVSERGIDRHAYIAAIGGGAVLDMAGFAAAVSHRGVRLIRIPTTVLAQNDSGVGVKNSVNAFNKKNFLGTFAPPFAVLNDFDFLDTLDNRDWRSGMAEAVKVALIKDADFFAFISDNAAQLASRDAEAMERLIHRCAELHLAHIASGDPFEMGSARPLDFGHWAAHKLEALTNYQLRHGEAVAIGIALDCTYAHLAGMLEVSAFENILFLLGQLGFDLYVPELSAKTDSGQFAVIQGLTEFQEHLGGQLTITLLTGIGRGVEVHEIDEALMAKAIGEMASNPEGEVEKLLSFGGWGGLTHRGKVLVKQPDCFNALQIIIHPVMLVG